MPELPEVETVRAGLATRVLGRSIAYVTYDWPKSFPNAEEQVEVHMKGEHTTAIIRRGKVLIFELSSGYDLLVHLKMTGQLVFVDSRTDKSNVPDRFGAGHPNDSLVGELPDKSTRVQIEFSDGSKLFFNDQRKFGWMKLLPRGQYKELDFFIKLGPEPTAPECTPESFRKRFVAIRTRNIKAALLDQSIIAGVGNIYADEALWSACIHPRTAVAKLADTQFNSLYTELRQVLRRAIAEGGSTDKNYVNAEGKRGNYLTFARVFRREGQPCYRCGGTIEKLKVAGRGTHVCPHCQMEVT